MHELTPIFTEKLLIRLAPLAGKTDESSLSARFGIVVGELELLITELKVPPRDQLTILLAQGAAVGIGIRDWDEPSLQARLDMFIDDLLLAASFSH